MNSFARVGYWAALICGIGAATYGVVSLTVAVVAPAAMSWEGYEQYAADYSRWPTMAVLFPPLVVTVVFPLLVLAIYATVAEQRRPFALLGLLFAGVYTAVLGSAYWLQITNVPWNIVRGAGEEIAPWVVWNPASFFWALETFAYFAMGLACVFAALAYTPGELPRRGAWRAAGDGPAGRVVPDLRAESRGVRHRGVVDGGLVAVGVRVVGGAVLLRRVRPRPLVQPPRRSRATPWTVRSRHLEKDRAWQPT